jgi:Zn-dependent protease with chaperone function
MRLPLELLVALLLAKFFQESCYNPHAPGWLILGGAAVMVAGCWLLPRLGWLLVRRRLVRRAAPILILHEAHARLMTASRCLSVGFYAAFLLVTGWAALVVDEKGLNAGVTVIGDDVLQLLPFALATVALWIADYPAVRGLHPADWSLGEYLRHQIRGWLFLLAPWLAMTAIFDSQPYWPWGLADFFKVHREADLALTVLVFGAALVFFPIYLVRLWPHRRLPDGELRSRLEILLVRARVRCRELVVWQTGRGRLPNAAVMGMVAPLRYVAFTDALLAELAPEEIEAVLAHEAAHVRHRHMAFYACFAVAFPAVTVAALWLLPESMFGSNLAPLDVELILAATMVALVVLYWRYAFGFLSRAFERQADAAACELVGSSAPLAAALERLALIAGAPREAQSWRHYSVAERVEFLARAAADPAVIPRHHRHVRRVKISLALVFVVAVGLLVLAFARERRPVGQGAEGGRSAPPKAAVGCHGAAGE